MKSLIIVVSCLTILSSVLIQAEGYVVRRKLRTSMPDMDKEKSAPKILRSGIRVRSMQAPVEDMDDPISGLEEPPSAGMTLQGRPVLDVRSGKWLFDWFWGYGGDDYYQPPPPPPGPPPPVQYEHCIEYVDPFTHDLVTDCTPL